MVASDVYDEVPYDVLLRHDFVRRAHRVASVAVTAERTCRVDRVVPSAVVRPRVIERLLRDLVARVAPDARILFPRRRDRRVWYSWNGRVLRPTGLTLESQLHEIAHLLLCPAERRSLIEFGLGPDPYRRSDARCTIRKRDADREELDVCSMQVLLARLLGLDERAVREEYREPPLTLARIRSLRRRFPNALPREWWRRAIVSAASA